MNIFCFTYVIPLQQLVFVFVYIFGVWVGGRGWTSIQIKTGLLADQLVRLGFINNYCKPMKPVLDQLCSVQWRTNSHGYIETWPKPYETDIFK